MLSTFSIGAFSMLTIVILNSHLIIPTSVSYVNMVLALSLDIIFSSLTCLVTFGWKLEINVSYQLIWTEVSRLLGWGFMFMSQMT
jgi:hypothetical protein